MTLARLTAAREQEIRRGTFHNDSTRLDGGAFYVSVATRELLAELDAVRREVEAQAAEVVRLTEERDALRDATLPNWRERGYDQQIILGNAQCNREDAETFDTFDNERETEPQFQRLRHTLAAQLAEAREKLAKVEALCEAWGIDYDDPAARLNEWADQQQVTTDSLLAENTGLRVQLARLIEERDTYRTRAGRHARIRSGNATVADMRSDSKRQR